MKPGPLHRAVLGLRRAAAGLPDETQSDGELLRRYVTSGDSTAFELLVWRHAGLVWSVCRRLLPREHDAEDAFQATFLALVRKAGSIVRGEVLASWLYKVASRVALHARAESAKQEVLPLPADEGPIRYPNSATSDWQPILDEELNRLPEKYRAPLLLCYLGGLTYEEAARELGCPKGTVAIRLQRGRQRLHDRLTRRGLSLSAGLPLIMATSLPSRLAADTARLLVGKSPMLAPRVTLLAQSVLPSLATSMSKLLTAATVAAVLLVGLGGIGLAWTASRTDEVKASVTEKPQGEPSNKELVERLASDNADQREAATRALLVRGKKALPDLRQGLEHKNPVVRKRIADLIVDINWKVPPAELLRPTKVRLVVKDMPLVEVAKELTRQAGIHIELDDLDASWSRRKFTLSLEETTFWEALDQVCQVARVHFIKDKRGLLIDDGSAPAYPVAYSGGVRLCLLPHTEARQPGAFRLELLVEPRLPITTAHAPQAIKGRDAQGNAISAEEKKEQDKGEWISHSNPLRLVVPLRLKGNAVAGTMLAELKGTILCSGEGRQSACLVDLATPGNKPTLSRDGRLRMTLGELTQTGDGTQVVPFDIEAHPSFKHDADNDSFHLFDDGGNPIRTSQTRYEFKKDEQTNEWTVSGIGFFGPLAARATPRRLLFNSAWRVERLEVPFQFRAIRLP